MSGKSRETLRQTSSWFQRTDSQDALTVSGQVSVPASTEESEPVNQPADETVEPHAVEPAPTQDALTLNAQGDTQSSSQTGKKDHLQVTVYLAPDDIEAIDVMQMQEFRRTRKKPDRSEIVRRAIRLLASQNFSS